MYNISANKIKTQNDNGNIYYPKALIDIVIYNGSILIEEKIQILEIKLNKLKSQSTNSINNKTGSSLTSNSIVNKMTIIINSIKTLEQVVADVNTTTGEILTKK